MISVERGDCGLFYATDDDQPGLFIAAKDRQELISLSILAYQAVDDHAIRIPSHTIWWHPADHSIMILPDDDWQTLPQSRETACRAWQVLMRLRRDRWYDA